jgi:hypothetical protein
MAVVSFPPTTSAARLAAAQDAQETMERLAKELPENDPARPTIAAFSLMLQEFAHGIGDSIQLREELAAMSKDVSDSFSKSAARVEAAARGSGQIAPDALRRIEAAVARTGGQLDDAATLRRLETAAATGATKAAYRQAFTGSAVAMVAVAALVLGAAAAGYWFGLQQGSTVATAEYRAIGDAAQAAFKQGQESARLWATLMQQNENIEAAWARCGEKVFFQNGRRGCEFALWVEPAPPAKGPTAAAQIPPPADAPKQTGR